MRNVQAAGVLIAAILAWVFLPHNVIGPVSLAVIGFVGLALYAIRAYLRRLEQVVDFLQATRGASTSEQLSSLLNPLERRILRVEAHGGAPSPIQLLRERQRQLRSVGFSLGLLGIVGGLVAILAFAD